MNVNRRGLVVGACVAGLFITFLLIGMIACLSLGLVAYALGVFGIMFFEREDECPLFMVATSTTGFFVGCSVVAVLVGEVASATAFLYALSALAAFHVLYWIASRRKRNIPLVP